MYKPSRFQIDGCFPGNIFKLNHLNKIQIENRFKMTQTLFRWDHANFHVGVDLQSKK